MFMYIYSRYFFLFSLQIISLSYNSTQEKFFNGVIETRFLYNRYVIVCVKYINTTELETRELIHYFFLINHSIYSLAQL